jgi:hypothetical protein
MIELEKIMSGMSKPFKSSRKVEPMQECVKSEIYQTNMTLLRGLREFYEKSGNVEIPTSIVSEYFYHSPKHQLTTVAVDSNLDWNALFIGTTDGKIIRLPFAIDDSDISKLTSGTSQTYKVFNETPVVDIIVYK